MPDFQNPFVRGLLGARQAADAGTAQNIQNLGGLLTLQNAAEMRPLQQEQLRIALENARLNTQIQRGLLTGGNAAPAAPMAFGEQGISTPGGGQANLATGQAVPAGAIPQAGGGMFRDANHAMQSMLGGNPGIIAAAKAYLEQQKPVVGREGAPVLEKGPNGEYRVAFSAPKSQPGIQLNYGSQGQATAAPIPGYNSAVTGITQAEEAGKAPYRLREVPRAGGGTQLMSEADYIRQQQQSGAALPAPQMRIPPAEQARRDVDAGRIRQAELQPNGGGMIPSSTVLGVGQTPQQRAEQTETGQILGKQFEKVMGDAGTAAIANRYLDTMEGMAKEFTPGKLTPMQNSLTQWAQAFGLPLSADDKRAAGSIQGLTSMAIKLAGQATRQSDAQPSQLQYFKILESMPNAERTPEGFSRIVGYMRDLNNVNIIKAQEAQKWKQERGTLDGFEAQWPKIAKDLPFTWNTDKSIADAGTAQAAKGGVRRYNPATGKVE